MRKIMMGTAAIALTAALGTGTAVIAAGAAEAATVAPATVRPSAQDVTWMKTNAQTDLAEIALGKLAMAKSHNTDLLMVAKVTLDNHEAALAKLKVVARKEGVALPAEPNAEQRATAAKLKTFPVTRFNLNWDTNEILGHKLSIKQTDAEISKGSAGAVTGFAKYYLPVAKMHLAMAEKLHEELT
jgi:putative membrane protein